MNLEQHLAVLGGIIVIVGFLGGLVYAVLRMWVDDRISKQIEPLREGQTELKTEVSRLTTAQHDSNGRMARVETTLDAMYRHVVGAPPPTAPLDQDD